MDQSLGTHSTFLRRTATSEAEVREVSIGYTEHETADEHEMTCLNLVFFLPNMSFGAGRCNEHIQRLSTWRSAHIGGMTIESGQTRLKIYGCTAWYR